MDPTVPFFSFFGRSPQRASARVVATQRSAQTDVTAFLQGSTCCFTSSHSNELVLQVLGSALKQGQQAAAGAAAHELTGRLQHSPHGDQQLLNSCVQLLCSVGHPMPQQVQTLAVLAAEQLLLHPASDDSSEVFQLFLHQDDRRRQERAHDLLLKVFGDLDMVWVECSDARRLRLCDLSLKAAALLLSSSRLRVAREEAVLYTVYHNKQLLSELEESPGEYSQQVKALINTVRLTKLAPEVLNSISKYQAIHDVLGIDRLTQAMLLLHLRSQQCSIAPAADVIEGDRDYAAGLATGTLGFMVSRDSLLTAAQGAAASTPSRISVPLKCITDSPVVGGVEWRASADLLSSQLDTGDTSIELRFCVQPYLPAGLPFLWCHHGVSMATNTGQVGEVTGSEFIDSHTCWRLLSCSSGTFAGTLLARLGKHHDLVVRVVIPAAFGLHHSHPAAAAAAARHEQEQQQEEEIRL